MAMLKQQGDGKSNRGPWGIDSSIGGIPWKINMEPENAGLEDYFPFQLGDF